MVTSRASSFVYSKTRRYSSSQQNRQNPVEVYPNATVMVVVSCPIPVCSFKTDYLDTHVVAVVLQLHLTVHSAFVLSGTSEGQKLDRPCVDAGINYEGWNAFVKRWDAYRVGSGLSAR